MLPQAAGVTIVAGGRGSAMKRIHPGGIWEVHLRHDPEDYRSELELQRGGNETVEDPYRFGPLLSDFDVHLHNEGTLYEAWKTMGAHLTELAGLRGARFAVWAPHAEMVSVAGDFNQWDPHRHPMRRRDGGIWEIFIPGVYAGQIYKYFVRSQIYGAHGLKCDPYGFASESPPSRARSSGTSRPTAGAMTPGFNSAAKPTGSSGRSPAMRFTWKAG